MKKAIDWLFDDNTSGPVEEVNSKGGLAIEFWGGEPFHNFEMMKKTYSYAMEKSKQTGKKVRFSGTTNGIELTEERLRWSQERHINWLISHDGILYDKYRVTPNKKGSFNIIDKNIDLYKEIYRQQPPLRMSLLPEYIPYLVKSYEYAISKGVRHYFFSPVYEVPWIQKDYELLEQELIKLYKMFILNTKNGYPPMYVKTVDEMIMYILEQKRHGIDLQQAEEYGATEQLDVLSNFSKNNRPCGAGAFYVGISVDGQIYICHRFNKHGLDPHIVPFDKRYGHIGNVWNGIYKTELRNIILNWDVNKKSDKCAKCKLRYYCKGHCYAINYDNGGSILQTPNKVCKINFAIYRAQLKIIELFKEYGLYDYENDEILYYGKKIHNNPYETFIIDKHEEKQPQTCICHSSSYTISSVENLLKNLQPIESKEFEEQVIDQGIHMLLEAYFKYKEQNHK